MGAMMSDKGAKWLLIGTVLGIMFACVMDEFFDSRVVGYKQAIAQCEATLPRTQHCKITAVEEK